MTILGLAIVIFYNFIINIGLLNEFLYQYEEGSLKTYAGTKYDNFLLFKHPQKTDLKENLDDLVIFYLD